MKVNFHYHFYSRIFISLLIFACGFFLWQKSVDTRALIDNVYQDNTPIVGWAWNDKAGWVALNCANDFNGDGVPDGNYAAGTGACASLSGTKWGLKMSSSTIDHDNNPTTPNILVHRVQGCAWAGGGTVEGTTSSTPGWICFSDPGGTNAPTDGVLMSQSTTDYTTCSCQMKKGICEGPLRNNLCIGPVGSQYCSLETTRSCTIDNDCTAQAPQACNSYYACSGISLSQVTNKCDTNTNLCTKSKNACDPSHGDDDCQFACANDSLPQFLAVGVCFDYTNYTSAQQQILRDNRGNLPPFSTGDSYMHSCYINKDCYDLSDSRNAGHPRGECVYPQYGILPNQGAGTCMINSTTPQADSATCVYDFDCDTGNYCALSITGVLPNAPTCESTSCVGGYEKINTTVTVPHFINALSTDPTQANSFASILKLESLSSLGANRLGFPVQSKVEDSYLGVNERNYDIDNPNLGVAGDNPIRGCFNCYREKKYQCLSGAPCQCANNDDNTCKDQFDRCEVGADSEGSCVVYDLGQSYCENCQEYFYYSAAQSTCRLQPDKSCTSSSDCAFGSGDACLAHAAGDLKKVLTGFNCSDCTIDNPANSCTLNAAGANNNRCNRCQTENPPGTFDSNVYRNGGVLYDNQHGKSTIGNLCGWAYNSWISASNNFGLGWFNFSPRISTSTKPYFSVEQGNIYSKNSIKTLYQPPISKYNASYLIESGGNITNFVSNLSRTDSGQNSSQNYQGELSNRPIIDFLTPLSGKFTNALGKLDYNGLISVAKTIGSVNYNKYNSPIDDEVRPNFDTIFATPLANKVFYIPAANIPSGTVVFGTTGADLEVKSGTGVLSGAGIVIVEGNLQINKNVRYQYSATISNLKQIPSLVWIVKGDVIVDPSVQDLVGTFIVLGDGSTSCTASDPSGCGQFKSGRTAQRPLIVRGNILARKFVLERLYVDTASGAPAEQFVNDGRLQSNPPLGLTDMSRVIPRFSSY